MTAPQVKISEFPVKTTVDFEDKFPIIDTTDTSNKTLTYSRLQGYVNSEGATRTAWNNAHSIRKRNVYRANTVYEIDDFLSWSHSNTEIIFEANSKIIPSVDGILAASIQGSAPATYIALYENALKWTNRIKTTANFNIGDFIEIKSEALIRSPNARDNKIGQGFRIRGKSSEVIGSDTVYTYTLDDSLLYDYLVSDTAEVGQYVPIQNVTIRNARFDQKDPLTRFSIYMIIRYAENIVLEDCVFENNKDYGVADIFGESAISIGHCSRNIHVNRPRFKSIGYYGIGIVRYTKGVYIYDIDAEDVRHAVSVVWSPDYGEPVNTHVIGGECRNATISSWDTHDTGIDTIFAFVTSYHAGDDGFQFRCPNVTAIECVSIGSELDGFSNTPGVDGQTYIRCKALGNKRQGFSLGGGEVECIGCIAEENGWDFGDAPNATQSGSVFAVQLVSGTWSGGSIKNNYCAAAIIAGSNSVSEPQGLLTITNLNSVASTYQSTFMRLHTNVGYKPELVYVNNSKIIGYGNQICRLVTGGSGYSGGGINFSDNITSDGSSGNETTIRATLINGETPTITTSALLDIANSSEFSDGFIGLRSKVDIRRIGGNGNDKDLDIRNIVSSPVGGSTTFTVYDKVNSSASDEILITITL